MTRAEFEARCEAEEALYLRQLEWSHISRQLDAAYAAMRDGDDSFLTRQRVGRLEALLAVLQGHPEALAG